MTWEEAFADWAKAPGKAEQERCDNTVRAIRTAIGNSSKLNYRDVSVFIHGSFRNRVNVRAESDVDAGVLYPTSFFWEPPPGYSRDQLGLESAAYGYPQFKNEVEEALVAHFGRAAVRRTNKTLEVDANTYRVNADVTPFFEYRRYKTLRDWHTGVAFTPDNGDLIVNWPEQNYANGVAKNQATGEAFKGVVRILKRLAVEMEPQHVAARGVCGFLIECMAYNTPNAYFAHPTWWKAIREILLYIHGNTTDDQKCAGWTETNALKYLFHPTQKWTRAQANAFIAAAWGYVGFQ